MSVITGAYGFQLRAPGVPLERVELPPLEPVDDQVVVEVAGCGVCHTDISFAVDGVPTRHPLPLILGHEISGRVVAGGEAATEWIGRAVIVPAVIPCEACPACKAGRPTICRQQFMPGNHGHGGFATHVLVPSRGLCPVPDSLPEGIALSDLSVVADAVTTPLEAIRRAALTADHVAVFIGVGGLGGFGVQLAAALGAAVVAIDVDRERLNLAAEHGAGLVLSANELDLKETKRSVRSFIKQSRRQGLGLKIFETSGTPAGQQTAFGLLDPGANLAVVGFHMDKVELRLSNLMAFDASAQGNWAVLLERYPEALDLVIKEKVVLGPFVETAPLDEAPAIVQAVAAHRTRRRMVLVPGGEEDLVKDHDLTGSFEPKEILYEERPVLDRGGELVSGLHNIWITLNNPDELNSYTTETIKEVILAFRQASNDRAAVAVVFTGAGDRAFCTGGNTREYAEVYAGAPGEYRQYMRLFNDMVTAILHCDKPVICRVNGMRVGGGQEIGMACDFSISTDLAIFSQAGPKHGSAPDGGSTDFRPLLVGMEHAVNSGTLCEPWSAHRFYFLGGLSDIVATLEVDGQILANPLVITDRLLDEHGRVVLGDWKSGADRDRGKDILKKGTVNLSKLDEAVDRMATKLLYTMPDCLTKTLESLRKHKLEHWDRNRETNKAWLALNMLTEANAGFRAFHHGTKTQREADFVKLRQHLAGGGRWSEELIHEIAPWVPSKQEAEVKPDLTHLVERVSRLYEDLRFQTVRDWKSEAPGRHAIGYMPIYVPRELIHAAGMLPVGILGGGDRLEIIRGDAYFQSYICHIPRSTIELALTRRLEVLDGMLFPSICDVIRNLSGMWQMLFPERYVRYVDLPQNFDPAVGGTFWRQELDTLREDLGRIGDRQITDPVLQQSIAAYNENRRVLRQLYKARSERPWLFPTSEVYLVLRAGAVLPVEDHTEIVRRYLDLAPLEDDRREQDMSRVVLVGMFCEQPPLGLLITLERAGCWIVDDDLLLGLRWMGGDVAEDGDPLQNIVIAYLEQSAQTASVYQPEGRRGAWLVDSVQRNIAEGVIFCAPSFCDPALLEQPMLVAALDREGIPHTQFKYSENTGQFAVIREQAGTFSDSIRLWSEA